MREFKDDEGRPWRLALTVASALRVRDMVTVDVTDDDTGERKQVPFDLVDAGSIAQTFQVLRSQFAKLGEILYAMLVKQVEERKLSREEFLDGLRGDSLESASKALEAELVDFFPQRLRKMVGLLGSKMDEVQTEMLGRAEAQMAGVTVETLTNAASGMPSGKPLESSESIQAGGPSDNSSQLETAA
jgi:hypothetical protein